MRSFFFRLTHKPSFKFKYSSVRIFYCKKVFTPVRFKNHVYFPVRWMKTSIYEILKDPVQLKWIREALFEK